MKPCKWYVKTTKLFLAIMKIFKQLIILIALSLLGSLCSYLLSLIHVSFPGSLIGLVLLFICLLTGLIKQHHIEDVGMFFINNMGIFFVPGAIMILDRIEMISTLWWKLLIIILGGFIVSFTATYWAVRLTLFLQEKHRKKKEGKVESEVQP